jgi:cytochrome c oxidase assembly factor 1
MERRADRELPSIKPPHPWLKTLPLFAAIIAAATLGIFNYQKSSSSVVSSTLFALRTHPRAREALGEQIYFKHKFPWIWGEMNQLHGRINIRYSVKGTKDSGMMTFRSVRKRRDSKVSFFFFFFSLSCLPPSLPFHSFVFYLRPRIFARHNQLLIYKQFVTEEWSLETSDGQKIQLLERDNPDPWDKPAVS